MRSVTKYIAAAIIIPLAGAVAAQDDHRPPKQVADGTYDISVHDARDEVILGKSGNLFYPLRMLGDDGMIRNCGRRFYMQNGALFRKCGRATPAPVDGVRYIPENR